MSLNLVMVIIISVGYVLIFKKIRKSKVNNLSKNRLENDRKFMLRVFMIVATDIVCWLPIIAFTYASYFGLQISDFIYSLSSIVLLPINSFINPFLYSKVEITLFKLVNNLKIPVALQKSTTNTKPKNRSNLQNKQATELSKQANKCKNKNRDYKLAFKTLKRERVYKPGTGTCRLCLKKSLLILECNKNCIIKRTKLMNLCRPRQVNFARRHFCAEGHFCMKSLLHGVTFARRVNFARVKVLHQASFFTAKEPAYISRVRVSGNSDRFNF